MATECLNDRNCSDASDLASLNSSQLPVIVQHNTGNSNKENKLALKDSFFYNGLPYTILTNRERTTLACLLAVAGLCSAISMPIYWTALPELARYFHTSQAKINYTVTAYLCFQSVAPVFISSFSDWFGRRPVILLCIISGIAVNIGIACTRSYGLLIFLRCLLATCLAPLISICSASVGDFSTRRNRGGLSSLTSGFTLIGQGFAPFIGSLVDSAWNWQAIFWFSAALEGVFAIIIFLILPETNRVFVGNMSVTPKRWFHRSPTLWYFKDRTVPYDEQVLASFGAVKHKYNPWKPLSLVKNIPVFIVLIPCSIQFATWTISQTSMTTHLQNDYGYSTLHVGLCFFAPGCATVLGSFSAGRIIDYIYAKKKSKYITYYEKKVEDGVIISEDVPAFNFFRARVMLFPYYAIGMTAATIAFGWCLDAHVSIVAILVFSFMITYLCMFPLSVVVTLLVDMYPTMAGGATALNNLFRCGMSAIFVSCLDYMEVSLTIGGTYTLMGGLIILSTISIVWLMMISERMLKAGKLG